MFGVHAKNYRLVKSGVRKSFPSEFADTSSIQQCFSCMILPLFTDLKWRVEASSEIECFPYTIDLKKDLSTQITVFIGFVWHFINLCNKLPELQTYPTYVRLRGTSRATRIAHRGGGADVKAAYCCFAISRCAMTVGSVSAAYFVSAAL